MTGCGGFRRFLRPLLAALLMIAGAVTPALADKRVALVIGNSTYQKVGKLPNSANDAAAVSQMFEKAGFQVVLKNDLGIAGMRTALREFADNTQDADIAIVYYAGHGIEIDGNNYLIPVDAVLGRDLDVDDETISLDRVLRVLEPVKRLRLVILDACRDNPFGRTMRRSVASRSIGRGLARVEPTTSDTLIAFAAKAGSIAADGEGSNSPFTKALLQHLSEPGLDLRLAFGRVRDQVLTLTNRKQEPFVYGSLGGSLVALTPPVAAPAAAPASPVPAPAATSTPSTDQSQIEITFWNSIRDQKKPEPFEAYLKRYPNGAFADLARIALAGMKPAEKPAEKPAHPAPEKPPQVASLEKTAAVSINGTWRWAADCEKGTRHFEGTMTFEQTGNAFTARHGFTNIFDIGTITDGRISGDRVLFTRQWGPYVDKVNLRYSGKLMQGVTMTDYSGRCTLKVTRN